MAMPLKLSKMPNGEPEVFTSIQGEGPSAGTASVFVRLSLCNLHCSWCDTKYTWDWENFDPNVEIVSITWEELSRRILTESPTNVVITGGEPLQQQDQLIPLVEELARKGRRIEIETNGTFVPSAQFAPHINQWNVSPKLSNAGDPQDIREVSEAICWYAARDSAFFKFVVEEPSDLVEVESLAHRYKLRRERILLSPQATDLATLTQRSKWLVDECVKRGFRFSPRLHIMIWGDERGR